MDWVGLVLLALALVLMMTTGWSTYAVLLGVCTLGAAVGLAAGTIQPAMLQSLPARLLGLLEADLLQALVIYGLVGALLIRLDLADSVYGGLRNVLRPALPRAAPAVSGLTLGALLAPTNGSVAASLMTLARSTSPHWVADGVPPARRGAMIALASTLGVIIPPSLVLLLLGEAMLRAHTEGLNLARLMGSPLADERIRVINTQDVMQAVLMPGALLLLGWMLITVIGSRRAAPATRQPWKPREVIALAVVPTAIIALLTLVATGVVRAVEGAATAGVVLMAWGLLSAQLVPRKLWLVLQDAMALTGALFALLVAATTFSLLLRLLGTDRLVADFMALLQGHPELAVLTVLLVLLVCAFVLDAFELIFLVIPIMMPPLLAQVGDAGWVAALVLLVLQLGFLLPPFGYSVVLARGLERPRPALVPMARILLPYLLWLVGVIALVLLWPEMTRWLRTLPMHLPPMEVMDADALGDLLRGMSAPRGSD